jgi:hypothetical protein
MKYCRCKRPRSCPRNKVPVTKAGETTVFGPPWLPIISIPLPHAHSAAAPSDPCWLCPEEPATTRTSRPWVRLAYRTSLSDAWKRHLVGVSSRGPGMPVAEAMDAPAANGAAATRCVNGGLPAPLPPRRLPGGARGSCRRRPRRAAGPPPRRRASASWAAFSGPRHASAPSLAASSSQAKAAPPPPPPTPLPALAPRPAPRAPRPSPAPSPPPPAPPTDLTQEGPYGVVTLHDTLYVRRADCERRTRLRLTVSAPAVAPHEPPLPGPPFPIVLMMNGFQVGGGAARARAPPGPRLRPRPRGSRSDEGGRPGDAVGGRRPEG